MVIEGNEELLDSVFGLSKKLGKVPFSTVVKKSTGFDVIPINPEDSSDKMLIDSLNKIFKAFLKTSTSTRSRYQGDRINEVGRRIEDALVHEMNKEPLTVKKLPKTGYPDIEISQTDRITYLEMKTLVSKEYQDLGISTTLTSVRLKRLQGIFFWIFQFHKKVKDTGR